MPFGTLGAGISGPNSVLKGLHAGEWSVGGANSLVTGNTGGMNVNVGGTGVLVQGNQAGTIKVNDGNGVVVVGNEMQRVRIWSSTGTRVGGPSVAERNFITGYGTTNSEGLPAGTDVELWSTTDTLIENNYIGTAPDGMSQGAWYQTMGIEVNTGNVGLRVRDNLIAGVLGHGMGPHWAGTLWGWAIYIQGTGSDLEFSGNTIGLDATGAALLPSVWGVHTASSQYTDVRFIDNVIAGHYLNGVTIGSDSSAVRLQGNRIYDNALSGTGFLGIDLLGPNQATGATPNDPGDADTGGNGLQNYPVLSSADLEPEGLRVTGVLSSSPSSQFTLEFFASPACGATGFGEGEVFLGSSSAVTDAAGQAPFDVLLEQTVAAGWVVSSTATLEPVGATSEFSTCVPVVDDLAGVARCLGDGTGTTCPCGNLGSAGHGCASSTVAEGSLLFASGSASAGQDDLVLRARDSQPSKPGVFFQGSSVEGGGLGNPFGDGLLCAGGTIVRLETVFASAQGAADSSVSLVAQGGVLPGQTLFYQWWYRDPVGSPCAGGFNTSNGVEITWLP